MATKVINSLTFGDTYVFTTPYGTSSDAADKVAKSATLSANSNFALEAGVRVIVKFTNENTASSPTLNVNNSGAKTIQFRGAAITSSLYRWAANSVVEFMYDGTYWQMLGAPNNTNSTYTVNDKKITLSAGTGLSGGGDFTLNQSSDETISFALADSGVTADSYGPSANASPAHSGTFSVPYITVDSYGRVTAASTKTITLPASGNTDQKVKQTKSTTTSYRAMLLGTTYSSTLGDLDTEETGQAYKTSNIVACPSTGEIKATKFTGALDGNAKTATNVAWSGVTSKPSYYDAKAIKSITRSGTTFTYTCMDDTTGTFTQQDNNTNKYHKSGSWSGLKYTATAVGSAEELSFTIPTGTSSTTVAVGNHTHTTSLATDSGTSSVTLAHGGKYKLTAGGTSVIFTMPASGNTDTKVNVTARGTTKAYILGTTTSPTSSATAVTSVAETGVYFDTTAAKLVATTFKGALEGNASTATKASRLSNTSAIGSTTKPVYFTSEGVPAACSYDIKDLTNFSVTTSDSIVSMTLGSTTITEAMLKTLTRDLTLEGF